MLVCDSWAISECQRSPPPDWYVASEKRHISIRDGSHTGDRWVGTFRNYPFWTPGCPVLVSGTPMVNRLMGGLSYEGKQYAIWNDKTKSQSKEIGASHPQGTLSHSKITDTLGIILKFQVLLKTDLLNAILHTNPL